MENTNGIPTYEPVQFFGSNNRMKFIIIPKKLMDGSKANQHFVLDSNVHKIRFKNPRNNYPANSPPCKLDVVHIGRALEYFSRAEFRQIDLRYLNSQK